MPDQEKAECWIAQYRVKSRSAKEWGAWATAQDYRKAEPAIVLVTAKREIEEMESKDPRARADMEWRVIHVTQEVVY